MVQLAQAAEITLRPDQRRREDMSRTIHTIAREVHSALLTRARLGLGGQVGRPTERTVKGDKTPIKGFDYNVAMRSVIHDVIAVPGGLGEDEGKYIRPIYEYLRQSRNAVCRDSAASPPLWFIAAEWDDRIGPGAIVTIGGRGTDPLWTPEQMKAAPERESRGAPFPVIPTPAERKLTKKEAGEDRLPAPVTVMRLVPDESEPQPEPVAVEEPAASTEASSREAILTIIANTEVPLTYEDINAALPTPLHNTRVGVLVRDLVKDGLVIAGPMQVKGKRRALTFLPAGSPLTVPDPVKSSRKPHFTASSVERILRVVRAAAVPLTYVEVAASAGLASRTVGEVVRQLVERGDLVFGPDRTASSVHGGGRPARTVVAVDKGTEVQPEPKVEPEPEVQPEPVAVAPEPQPEPVVQVEAEVVEIAPAPAPAAVSAPGPAAAIRDLRDRAARAEEWKARAEAAEAERDRLAAELAEIQALLSEAYFRG
jgi:hypothetical protein